VASAALPEHGLAVGADGSLWTCDGIAWAQLAGAGGTLGPVPNDVALQFGTGTSYGTITYFPSGGFGPNTVIQSVGVSGLLMLAADGAAVDLDGQSVEIVGGGATGTGDGGDVTIAGGNATGTGDDGAVVFLRGFNASAVDRYLPPPQVGTTGTPTAFPGGAAIRAVALGAAANTTFVVPFDGFLAQVVVYGTTAGAVGAGNLTVTKNGTTTLAQQSITFAAVGEGQILDFDPTNYEAGENVLSAGDDIEVETAPGIAAQFVLHFVAT